MTSPEPPQSTPALKPRTWTWFLVRSVLIYAVTPYVAIIVMTVLAQRSLIYRPTIDKSLTVSSFSEASAEDVEIRIDGRLTLHGWKFHGKVPARFEEKFLVIYFPGNGGCRRDRVSDCREFADLSCDLILFDYRGYGDNAGSPSETVLAGDARRIWEYATTTLKFPADRIVLFGESLGGAMATRLASEQSQAGTPPAALILNSTFASLGETVAWHFPAFPFQYFLWDRYPSVERIGEVTCPILQYHGTADEVVAYQHGERLFRAASTMSAQGIPPEFITIPGGVHNFISMAEMQASISQLLSRICRGRLPAGDQILEQQAAANGEPSGK